MQAWRTALTMANSEGSRWGFLDQSRKRCDGPHPDGKEQAFTPYGSSFQMTTPLLNICFFAVFWGERFATIAGVL